MNNFKWPIATNPCWSSWHPLHTVTKASSTTTPTVVSLWLLLGIMSDEVKPSKQRESTLDLSLCAGSCSMAALFHTLFTSLLQNVFAQRQLVIYLNVVRAELLQCRMLLTRSLWTRYIVQLVHEMIFLFLWWRTRTFNVWCLYGGKMTQLVLRNAAAGLMKIKNGSIGRGGRWHLQI